MIMLLLSCGSVTVLSSVLAVVLSTPPATYYECEQYPGTQWYQIDKTRRVCTRETVEGEDFVFCRHWECETPKCPEEEQITRRDGCKSCPGFCSSGGKSYPEGKSFKCADNVNSCWCMRGGGLASTRIGYFRQSLCNAPATYYECEQYPGTQWDQIDKTRRVCIVESVEGVDFVFCRHWECETPTCPEEEQVSWGDGCKSCPGFCSSGGKSYAEGESFKCADNVNFCTCLSGGGLTSTEMGYFRQSLCNATMI